MKHLHLKGLVSLVLAILCITSCDMARRVAGRPTRSDIAAKRERIRLAELAEKARQDSIALVKAIAEKDRQDSIAAVEAFNSCSHIVPLNSFGKLYKTELGDRYYLSVGSFRQVGNAEKMARKFEDSGYVAVLARFSSGVTAVLVSPSARIQDLYESYKRVREESYCPADVWVLVNE